MEKWVIILDIAGLKVNWGGKRYSGRPSSYGNISQSISRTIISQSPRTAVIKQNFGPRARI